MTRSIEAAALQVQAKAAVMWLSALSILAYAAFVAFPASVNAGGSCCIATSDCVNDPGTYCDRSVPCSIYGSCVANS